MSLYLIQLVIITIFVVLTHQITIPLTQNYPRCMVIYTSSPDENLILDVKFPTVPNAQENAYFLATLINTQNNNTSEQRVHSGLFRKQLDLMESVVYKICFAFMSSQRVGNILIQYNAQTKFGNQLEKVKVPQSFLKTEDLKQTYQYAESTLFATKVVLQFQTDKRKKQDAIYQDNTAQINTLSYISMFEIGVILLTGVYQFFNLRNFLLSKGYI